MSKWIDDIMEVVSEEVSMTKECSQALRNRLGDLVLVVRFE